MRIQVYFKNNRLMDYINCQKNHNKIPKTFEILSTKIGCPRCKDDSLVSREGYTPSIDSFCCYNKCHHTLEVKSILAEGNHKDAFIDLPFVVKMGSVRTYENINKKNKTLLLFWYNIIERENDFVKVVIRNCLTFEMEKLFDGKNCSTEIVLQRKKTKFKPRLNLRIFPESCNFKALSLKDFKYDVSVGTKRQEKVIIDCIIRKQFEENKKKKKLLLIK